MTAPNFANDPLVAAAAYQTVGGIFRWRATWSPEKIALQFGERTRTYGELNERVNRAARALSKRGVQRGHRIAVLSENRPEYIELGLACAKLGAIVACQNWRQSETELSYCIRLVEPTLVVVSERHAATLARIDHGGEVLNLGDEYERALAAADPAEPDEVAQSEDGFVILYTSGSTGMPKGALISQRAIIARDIMNRLDRPVDEDAAFVAWGPLYHMGASDMTYASLMRGAKVVVMDGFDAPALISHVAREKQGWLMVMPGTQDRVLAELRRTGSVVKKVQYVGAMADLIPRNVLAEITSAFQAPYVNTFGATETGSMPFSRGLIPVGVVPERLSKVQSSLCQIRLVDPDDNDVPDGQPGEVIVRGPSLFSGYWGAPEVNAEDFRGGWFHLGDVFVRNPDGTYDFVDRRKYLIKSGGENIYPAEIERVLLKQPSIADAVVVRKADARWGEVPVAFVVRRNDALTADDVIAACKGTIANYKLPKEIRFVNDAELPRNTTGKIVRHELERRLKAETSTAT